MACIAWPAKFQVPKTVLIFFAYLVVGWSDSLFGPFYSQFQVSLAATTAETSYLVQSSFLGFTLGNLILLLQSNCWSLHGAYVCSILWMAAANLSIPYIRSLELMCAVFFVNGFAGGTIQAGSISRILILWGSESAVFLQLLDFCYSTGSIIGPFISAPFLVEIPSDATRGENGTTTTLTADDLMIVYPYSIIGSFGGVAFLLSLVIFFIDRKDDPHPSRSLSALTHRPTERSAQQQPESIASLSLPSSSVPVSSYDSSSGLQTKSEHNVPEKESSASAAAASAGSSKERFWRQSCVISLASLTYAFTNGIGMIEQNFLTKYVTIGPFHLTAVTGASMTGSSWIIHTICGIFFVFLIRRLGIAKNLLFGAFLIFVSANVLLLSSLCHPTALLLWLVVAGISVGGTTFFSCLVAFMESKFPVTPRMTSLYLITNCVCNVVWPALVGQFIETTPAVFVLVIYACSAVSLAAVILMLFVVNIWFRDKEKSERHVEQ